MSKSHRIAAAVVLSFVALTGVAAPNAGHVRHERAAVEQPAPYNPNPFHSLLRFLARLIGVHPDDGGQISPPHPDA